MILTRAKFMQKYVPVLFILYALIGISPTLSAHTFNTVSYVQVEIVGNQMLFPNLSNESVSSHLFMAGYPDLRAMVLENIIIKNNNAVCTLGEFLIHTADEFSNAPYFFIATCPDPIENFTITDTFDLETIVYKVYNLHYNDTSFSYTSSQNIEIIGEIRGERMISITPVADDAPINNTDNTAIVNNSTGDTTNNANAIASNTDNGANVSRKANKQSLFLLYLYLGLQHILSGLDHILFILGFILLATTFAGLLKGVTGFTISHSLTLTLAAMSILTLNARIVEPLIGLSIGIVGILAIFNLARQWLLRFGIIFVFGLFHGLGFAGSIAEVGFPKEGFVLALLGFNLGIEAGQLLIVFAVFPLLSFIKQKSMRIHSYITNGMAIIISVAGLFWFVQRLFFTA